ncbi:unnamed protein product [Protopolystoma xenopodis]|uniref:Uncharacterized protein n=1 Tax=Protopolystoma xenopodis TaxID=117903 RepID=A0A448X1U9_9PLAT|nr:unnamed protein product [Protopolystoma xenopodis]
MAMANAITASVNTATKSVSRVKQPMFSQLRRPIRHLKANGARQVTQNQTLHHFIVSQHLPQAFPTSPAGVMVFASGMSLETNRYSLPPLRSGSLQIGNMDETSVPTARRRQY